MRQDCTFMPEKTFFLSCFSIVPLSGVCRTFPQKYQIIAGFKKKRERLDGASLIWANKNALGGKLYHYFKGEAPAINRNGNFVGDFI